MYTAICFQPINQQNIAAVDDNHQSLRNEFNNEKVDESPPVAFTPKSPPLQRTRTTEAPENNFTTNNRLLTPEWFDDEEEEEEKENNNNTNNKYSFRKHKIDNLPLLDEDITSPRFLNQSSPNDLQEEIEALRKHIKEIRVETEPFRRRCNAPGAVEMAIGGPTVELDYCNKSLDPNKGRDQVGFITTTTTTTTLYMPSPNLHKAGTKLNITENNKYAAKNKYCSYNNGQHLRKQTNDILEPSIQAFSNKQPPWLPRLNLANIYSDNEATITSPNRSKSSLLVSPRSAFSPASNVLCPSTRTLSTTHPVSTQEVSTC